MSMAGDRNNRTHVVAQGALRQAAEDDDASSSRQRPGIFSCVVDRDPRFHLEALRWFATLTSVVGVDPNELVVHAIDGCSSDALDHLRASGVNIRRVDTFDSRAPHCNKIAAAQSLARTGVEGVAVLSDTDVVVLDDPRPVLPPTALFAGKLVDRPNPPLPTLERIFKCAGLTIPSAQRLDWFPDEWTVPGNCNGGVYLVSGAILSELTASWANWACWLLDRPSVLEAATVHLDQVAMAMALTATQVEPVRLGVEWNMPTHNPRWIPSEAPRPAVIHYHQRLDATGLILRSGVRIVDEAIDTANSAVRQLWCDAFPNHTFWDWRYRTNPELGSGIGSRGKALENKRALLTAVANMLRPRSVLDVGCGDGETTKGMALGRYIGFDVSAAAISRARLVRPDGEFHVGTLDDASVVADLTLCLDVLIHQPDRVTYESLLGRLVRSARRALLVSGYDQPPTSGSPMVHFHEPLSLTLRRLAPEAELYPVREDHEITSFLMLRPAALVGLPIRKARSAHIWLWQRRQLREMRLLAERVCKKIRRDPSYREL